VLQAVANRLDYSPQLKSETIGRAGPALCTGPVGYQPGHETKVFAPSLRLSTPLYFPLPSGLPAAVVLRGPFKERVASFGMQLLKNFEPLH